MLSFKPWGKCKCKSKKKKLIITVSYKKCFLCAMNFNFILDVSKTERLWKWKVAKLKQKTQLVSGRKKKKIQFLKERWWYLGQGLGLFSLPKQDKAFQFCIMFGFCSCCWGKNMHKKFYQGVYYILCYSMQTSDIGIMIAGWTASFICSPDRHLQHHIFLFSCRWETPTAQCRSLHNVL